MHGLELGNGVCLESGRAVRRRTFLGLPLVLAGCAAARDPSPMGPRTPAQWDPEIKVTRDSYTLSTQVVGPWYGPTDSRARLVCAVKGERRAFAVQFRVRSNGWMFLDQAYDGSGVSRKVSGIDRDVGFCSVYLGCTVTEAGDIYVDAEYLTASHERGIDFSVRGSRGSAQIFLPGDYVTAVTQRALTVEG